MKSIVVTGASGFVGRHTLNPLLTKNYIVHAFFSSRKPEITHPNLYWHQVDLHEYRLNKIQNLFQVINPQYLLHLAWYVNPKTYRTSLNNLQWLNSSVNLLKTFAECGGKRCVIAGSAAEYDWQYGHCREFQTPCSPNSLYGIAKHSLRLIAEKLAADNGISCAWGRLFFLFGPHEYPERFISSLIFKLLKKEIFQLKNGYQIRDFMFVEDVASAFVALLDSSVEGPVNIASGNPISLKELVSKISLQLNAEEFIEFNKKNGHMNDILLTADISRLVNEVGWKAQYTLESALNKTILWWKENL